MTIFRNILHILTTLAALLYVLFFIGEAIPPYDPNMGDSNFGIFMVFVLFLLVYSAKEKASQKNDQ